MVSKPLTTTQVSKALASLIGWWMLVLWLLWRWFAVPFHLPPVNLLACITSALIFNGMFLVALIGLWACKMRCPLDTDLLWTAIDLSGRCGCVILLLGWFVHSFHSLLM